MFMHQNHILRSTALWGLVLAGGEGKRLESYVRRIRGEELPKQYVNFIGQRSMLEHTFQRAEKLIPLEQILTIISKHHLRHADVRRQLSDRAKENVILQPENKETGPGIFLPLIYLYKRCPEAIVAVFPSDHFILEEDRFMDHVALAARAVAHDPSQIVLLAMESHRPEVEYGYVLPRDGTNQFGLWGTRRVARFIEKPGPQAARELVRAGGLWNTMIMVFKVKTLLVMAQNICPATCRRFARILEAVGTRREQPTVDEVYRTLEPMNFSKDFLEKASATYPEAVSVLPVLQVHWSDWGSLQRLLQVQHALRQPSGWATQPRSEPASAWDQRGGRRITSGVLA